MEKEYLSEEKYLEDAKKLKKTGKLILIIGGIVFVLGLLFIVLGFLGIGGSFGANDFDHASKSAFGGFGIMVVGGFLDSVGSTLLIVGGIVMFIAHRREIVTFTTQQVMPVAKEGIEKMAPTAGVVAKEITKGIKEGLKEENSDEEK